MPIKVLVVDDSALVRKLLSAMLMHAPDIKVVGTASDPYAAREKIKSLNPDVITLDVEMPRMDGITFLENLMRLRPTPVVMVSSLTQRGADVTLRALELGAIDFVAKPRIDIAGTLEDYESELIAKVRVAAQARVAPRSAKPARATDERHSTSAVVPVLNVRTMLRTTDRIIAI
ncbi:MAG TPA: response regulator, partial [Steroidobacteraceae bacterium]|nr:response regulator [Steroidobacteraceae bacterium]